MGAEKPRDSSDPTVLIVDDEIDMRLFISTVFKTSGYKAVTARDGHQGLIEASKEMPDLIVLDIMMPGEGGAKMYRGLRDDPRLKRIPVIILSGVNEKAFQHYLSMLNSKGGYPIPPPEAYMEKPPDPDALLALARKITA